MDVDVVIRGRFSPVLLFSSALDRSSCADFAIPFAAIRIGRVIEAVSTLLVKAIIALEGSSLPKELQGTCSNSFRMISSQDVQTGCVAKKVPVLAVRKIFTSFLAVRRRGFRIFDLPEN